MPNWKRLEKLNGGKPILYVEPRLDAKNEVWFHAASNELRVWSDGVLLQDAAKATKRPASVSARFTLYKLLDQLFVDVEIRGDQALLRRGVLNGANIVTLVAPSEVEKAKPSAPKKRESSWNYFARVYGSITWVLAGEADEGLSMFYCGNVTGGGWSCLEIDSAGTYEIDELVEATGIEELENLFVFHGGWHDGRSFAFDWRESSPSGEYAIIPFDENIQELPKPTKPARIEPFGQWLYKRVSALTRIAERNLREVN